MDYSDIAATGVFSNILTSIEPAIALSLASAPYIPKLLRRSGPSRFDKRHSYSGGSRSIGKISSKKVSQRSNTLDDDDDNGSDEIQLHPVRYTPEGIEITTEDGRYPEEVNAEPGSKSLGTSIRTDPV